MQNSGLEMVAGLTRPLTFEDTTRVVNISQNCYKWNLNGIVELQS